MKLERRNLEKLYIFAVLFFIAVDFVQMPDVPSSLLHSDHSFHIIKFELVRRHGLTGFPELGSVSLRMLLPIFLVPFTLLSFIIPYKLAYQSTYFLLLLFTYLGAKKIQRERGRELEPLLAILFPFSAFFFFRFGRLLELAAHLPLLLLFDYLESGDDPRITTLLFMLGATSHLPTLLLYLIPISLKLHSRRKFLKHAPLWAISLLPWLIFYIPNSMNVVGWKLPRLVAITTNVLTVAEKTGFGWTIWPILILFAAMAASVWFMGKDGRRTSIAMVPVAASTILVYLGSSLPLKIPGFNQIIPTSMIPLFSYLLLKKYPKAWAVLAVMSFAVVVWPLPWEGAYTADFELGREYINGSYIFTMPEDSIVTYKNFFINYMAHLGMPTPLCSTWEYADPEWALYSPKNCSDLKVVDYFVVPRTEDWVKTCGEYREGRHIIIVKTDTVNASNG